MVCQNCHKENRSKAKFCKWCGQQLVTTDLLDKLVGLDEVKNQLKTIVDTYTFLRSRKDISKARISLNAIVMSRILLHQTDYPVCRCQAYLPRFHKRHISACKR